MDHFLWEEWITSYGRNGSFRYDSFLRLAVVVYTQNNSPEPMCSQISAAIWGLSLLSWLLGFGIASIILFFLTAAGALLLDSAAVLYYVVAFFGGLFSFIWMVMGSVALFRDDHSCQAEAYSLWAACLACLISYYVATGLNCIFGAVLKQNKD